MTDLTDLQAASLALWAKLVYEGTVTDEEAVKLLHDTLVKAYRLGEDAGIEKALGELSVELAEDIRRALKGQG